MAKHGERVGKEVNKRRIRRTDRDSSPLRASLARKQERAGTLRGLLVRPMSDGVSSSDEPCPILLGTSIDTARYRM